MLAGSGRMTMWSTAAASVPCSVAAPLTSPTVPVRGGGPAAAAGQVGAVHEPSGAIVNVVIAFWLPRRFSYWSRPKAVYVCDPPGTIVADDGASTRWSRAPGLTVRTAELVSPLLIAVTVCAPAVVAVQMLPVHEPSGLTVKVVPRVKSPSELPAASNPSVV